MKKILLFIILSLFVPSLGVECFAMHNPDEEDYDESIRMPIRRLHPERQQDSQHKSQTKDKSQSKDKSVPPRPAKKVVAQKQVPYPSHSNRNSGSTTSSSNDKMMRELLSKDYSIKVYKADALKPMKWKDEPVTETQSELLPYFNKTVLRSGDSPEIRYLPKTASMNQTDNAIYLYFDLTNSSPRSLHLRAQYYADDPLLFNKIVFTIDGFDYTFTPSSINRGKLGGRMIWENCDETVNSGDKDLIYALSHGSWVRVTFIGGRGINHVRMLTDDQIKDFRRTLDLYRDLGGII
jgi:hypothetical protein